MRKEFSQTQAVRFTCILFVLQAFRDEAEAVGAAKKAQRAADKAARDPDDVQLNVIEKVMAAVARLRTT